MKIRIFNETTNATSGYIATEQFRKYYQVKNCFIQELIKRFNDEKKQTGSTERAELTIN